MGVSVNKTAKSDSSVVYCLTQATEDDAIWEELIQRTECCGFIRNKVIKSTPLYIQKESPGKKSLSAMPTRLDQSLGGLRI